MPDPTHTTPDQAMPEIMKRLREFRERRGWEQDHTPRNLASSISIEAAELLEHFQWGEPSSASDFAFVAMELADVLIYALNLAQILGIDPVKVINDKITTNELRFPAPGDPRPIGGC